MFRYYPKHLVLKLNRQAKILSKRKEFKKNKNEPDTRNKLSEFLLIRILGNDHYPRHSKDQTLNNLRFILENESNFKDCRKLFILNRIFDKRREQDLIDLLERQSIDYLRIPFNAEEYAKTGWRVDEFGGINYFTSKKFNKSTKKSQKRQTIWAIAPKINYVMNINGARNLAIDEGRRTANWTFVLDGNCIFKENDFRLLCSNCIQNTNLPYIIIPFSRLSNNADFFNNNIIARPEYEEPQIGFHFTAREGFNSYLPYGILDKAELFKILGVPGEWTSWGNFPWIKTYSRKTIDKYLYKISSSVVYRLSSGTHGLEMNSAQQARYQSRLDSIIKTIHSLTSLYGTKMKNYKKIIFSNKNLESLPLTRSEKNH